MSRLVFRQAEDQLLGLFVYDADPSWTLHPLRSREGGVYPLCDNGEGTGTWLAFAPKVNLWGGLLRRGDAPYNDCLPPSETFLREAFRSESNLEGLVQTLQAQAGSAFHNPFNAVVGDRVRGEVRLLKQGFNSTVEVLPPGSHYLEDERPVDDPDALPPFLREESGFPCFGELRGHAQNDGDWTSSSQSGMRPTRAATVFEWTRERLRIDHCPGYPPETPWEDHTLEPTPRET